MTARSRGASAEWRDGARSAQPNNLAEAEYLEQQRGAQVRADQDAALKNLP